MESVTATGTVRRTVRTAVALVVGQALLCALIGWLTFGRSPAAAPGRGSPSVDQLALPPAVPPTSTDPSSSAAPSAPASGAMSRAASGGVRRVPPPPAVSPAASASPSASTPPTATAEPSTLIASSTTETPVPPAPPPPPTVDVQSPVLLGAPCRPVDALGLTADGIPVRCVGPKRARWKIA